MVHCSVGMPYISEVVLQWYGFNAEDLDMPLNSNVCDVVTPVNVEDGA